MTRKLSRVSHGTDKRKLTQRYKDKFFLRVSSFKAERQEILEFTTGLSSLRANTTHFYALSPFKWSEKYRY